MSTAKLPFDKLDGDCNVLMLHFIVKHIDIKLECGMAKIINAISISKKSCNEEGFLFFL